MLSRLGWLLLLLTGLLAMSATLPVRAQEQAVAPTGPSLNFPAGLASDGTSVYVANSRNDTIVRIDIATHGIGALAGQQFKPGSNDGVGAAGMFSSPDGLVLVGGALYVADTENSDIRKVDVSSGAVTTIAGTANIAGSEKSGEGLEPHFNLPTQIASDGTFLFVADTGNSTIRKIDLASKKVSTIGGQAGTDGKDDGPATKSTYNHPRGIATDGKFVYVADTANQLIRKIDLSSAATTTFAGQAGVQGMQDGVGAAATFNNPEALACDGINLYLADSDNQAIRKIALADGTVSTITQVNGHIGSGITVTKDGSTVYFSDTTSNAVQRLDVASKNVTPLAPL
jgi:sugar lactone lactonase YvrE